MTHVQIQVVRHTTNLCLRRNQSDATALWGAQHNACQIPKLHHKAAVEMALAVGYQQGGSLTAGVTREEFKKEAVLRCNVVYVKYRP